MASPTNSWQRTIRTALAVLVSGAALVPVIVAQFGITQANAGKIVGAILVGAAAITRIMAIPAVNDLIAKLLPSLAIDTTVPPVGLAIPSIEAPPTGPIATGPAIP